MKRWQDRGEVQDSDEDDLSLGTESQSPEQARKRLKTSGDYQNGFHAGSHAGNGIETAVSSSGKRPVSNAVATMEAADKADETLNTGTASTEGEIELPTDLEESEEPGWATQSNAVMYGRRGKLPQHGTTHGRELVPLISQVERDAVSLQAFGGYAAHTKESESTELDREPHTSSSDTAEQPHVLSSLVNLEMLGQRENPSRGSSPLSDLSEPLEFLSPVRSAVGQHQNLDAPHAAPIATWTETVYPSNDQIADKTTSLAPIRRSLRTRQEKQLRPYMYDKALYQRQCRERGLRPVRLVEKMLRDDQNTSLGSDGPPFNTDTQPSSSAHDASSQSVEHAGNQPTLANWNLEDDQGLGAPSQHHSDDELPDIDALVSRTPAAHVLPALKKRKLNHHSDRHSVSGNLAGPPSPSSTPDRAGTPILPQPSHRFRLPRGLSPVALPTPSISSNVKHAPHIDAQGPSSGSSPPRSARKSTIARPFLVSDDSSTESEPASGVESRSLHRERRRIRGVLPASWLKIDQKAQRARQPSRVTESEDPASPPRPTVPQKGIAQKVQTRTLSPRPLFSDASSSDDTKSRSISSFDHHRERSYTPTMRQQRLLPRDDDGDINGMEVDWINPMLPAVSRPSKRSSKSAKRQPRITEALRRVQSNGLDFEEERRGLNYMCPLSHTATKRSSARARQSLPKRPRPPCLSILDVPESPTQTAKLPIFVQLAKRNARQTVERARQSPSYKSIRLATRRDTEDATDILRQWQNSKIPQRQIAAREAHSAGAGNLGRATTGGGRVPLFETKANQRQSHIPALSSKPAASSHRNPVISMSGTEQELPQTPRPNFDTSTRDKLKGKAARVYNGKATIVRYRNAQLESAASTSYLQDRPVAFQQRIACLTEAVARDIGVQIADDIPLTRFLEDGGSSRSAGLQRHRHQIGYPYPNPQQEREIQCAESAPIKQGIPRRPRKAQASRFNVDTREFRQPSEPLPDFHEALESYDPLTESSKPILHGLGPFGTRYAVDFDIRPLPRGTYFHESTFIGSGELAASLSADARDFNASTGTIRIYVNGVGHEWGAWSDEVSTVIGEISESTSAALKTLNALASEERIIEIPAVVSNVDHMLRSMIRYVSRCLYFYDPVDRGACSRRLCQFVDGMLETTDDATLWKPDLSKLKTRVLQHVLVLARQSLGLSRGVVPISEARKLAETCTLAAASRLASHTLYDKLEAVRDAYEECRTATRQEMGIRDDDSVIATLVVLRHTLCGHSDLQSILWDVISNALRLERPASESAIALDKAWYELFTILPSLDFNTEGMIECRGDQPEIDWKLPKRLLEVCLKLYTVTSHAQGSTINAYIRAVFTRCWRLIVIWKWWRCEAILGIIYDFFACRNLCLLHKEEARGSPKFLDNLANIDMTNVEVETADSSFAIFLKMLVSALRGLHYNQIYTDKKIGGVAWRFIPNHARLYRRDAEVRQVDLDALRNHCDLLCTLYFASPPGHRPRIDLLRNLVDHSTSHREACRISVRAWANLASYQTSTDESIVTLEPFVDWFKEMTQTTITQYRLARTEAEQQYASAQADGNYNLTSELLEQTVASNQRQIAATLVDLLAALRRAVESSSNLQIAISLFRSTAPWTAFDSFALSERRLKNVFLEALDLLKKVKAVQRRFVARVESQPASDDSQDYGDYSALTEFAGTQAGTQAYASAEASMLFQKPLGHLLSNAFGSELAPDDVLLAQIVDLWVLQASELVHDNTRSWSNFVDEYTSGAWYRLRETEQWRKFTPYFIAQILTCDPEAFLQLRHTILAAWLTSLVERESALKYQHLLTAAVLNAPQSDPLVSNLPFSKHLSTGVFAISLHDIRQRRLGLLSSFFSNMRLAYEDAVYERPQALPELRRTFSDILRKVMQAMKSNYEELQLGTSNVAETDVQGAYVEFVHQVISFMQQYTTEICPIDRFFTDSSAFPLPSTDPGYVVGRLRSYLPKLVECKTRKQLAVFVHAVSERAAVDGKQEYLVEQLAAATSGEVEHGNERAPSLRHVLLSAIFPAYSSNAVSDPCTWIFALPILEASARCCAQLMYDTNLDEPDSVNAALNQVDTVLHGVERAIAPVLAHHGLLGLQSVARTLAAMLRTCQSTLSFVYHVQRSTGLADNTVAILWNLQDRFKQLRDRNLSTPDYSLVDTERAAPTPLSETWADTTDFAARQVRESMANDWYAIDGKFFVRRGNTSKEVVVEVVNEEEEREILRRAFREFQEAFDRQQRLRRRRDSHLRGSALGLETLVT